MYVIMSAKAVLRASTSTSTNHKHGQDWHSFLQSKSATLIFFISKWVSCPSKCPGKQFILDQTELQSRLAFLQPSPGEVAIRSFAFLYGEKNANIRGVCLFLGL